MDNKNVIILIHIHLALLLIRTTLLGPELPSPATLLFDHPIRGIMPIVNRSLIHIDNDDEHHKALVQSQTNNDRDHYTPLNYTLLPIGSTAALQQVDSDRLTHGTIVVKGDHNHNNRSYIICITNTARLITRNNKNM